jgi:hypothetical protein
MKSFMSLAVAAAIGLLGSSLAMPVADAAESQFSVQLPKSSFIFENMTYTADIPIAGSGRNLLKLTIHNNYPGNSQYYAYVTGKLASTGQYVMLKRGSSWLHPSANSFPAPPVQITDEAVKFPLNSQGYTDIILPDYVISGRVYIAEGELQFSAVMDPQNQLGFAPPDHANSADANHNTNWGFFEFTLGTDGVLWCNPSFVDFVGLPIGVKVNFRNGGSESVPGLQPDAIGKICQEMEDESNRSGVGAWRDMCKKDNNGRALRVLAPRIYVGLNNADRMTDYYRDYVNQVWDRYRRETLILKVDGHDVRCNVNGDTLNCADDRETVGFGRPAVIDIWGCNDGVFAVSSGLRERIRPILCAAFTRTTLLRSEGNVQPGPHVDTYYTSEPTNHYARLVHKYELGHRGYAFSFDDVHPEDQKQGVEQSGEIAGQSTQVELFLGGGM